MAGQDVIVIGAGMAGASAAFEIAAKRRVLLLERESQPGYHSTGRSAATYLQSYGNATVRALTVAAWPFLSDPPAGFAAHPILSPRGVLVVARADQLAALETLAEECQRLVPDIRLVEGKDACALAPALRQDYVAAGMVEPGAMDIDIAALHQCYLRGLRARGGTVVTDAEVLAVERAGSTWRVRSRAGTHEAAIVVNAAGAWADEVARFAGARPIGLVPKRRTAILFDPGPDFDVRAWPLTADVDEEFYFKPDAGKILASPADETPSAPCDAQPEELDVAICVDRLERATTFEIRRIEHRWAGLRSFVADKSLVCGYDSHLDSFFWLAGQGGYGIQTAPSMARIAAALIEGQGLPEDIAALGVTEAALSPARCQRPR